MLEVEQPTLIRLRERLLTPFGLKIVESADEVAGATDLGPYIPGVFLMAAWSEVVDDPNGGDFQIEKEYWQTSVLVAYQQIKDQAEPKQIVDTAAQRASAILKATAGALVGWRPAKGYLTFAYRGRPDPIYQPGYGEFPALFETGLIITGT
ncbi:MAG: hypothetical protein KZQ93_15815 [Candidatus Thiodiazotropha sp. (ex Monitilora ramsayi)]|nr:hypothetical protein [Candidatus Thiodiazotropha sp. (ex Monitilora ramsayi)]